MAFHTRNLTILTYSNGFTLWLYRTKDPASSILGRRYFLAASDMLRDGDLIVINSNHDNIPSCYLGFVADARETRIVVLFNPPDPSSSSSEQKPLAQTALKAIA